MRASRIQQGIVTSIILATVEEGEAFDPESTWVDVTNIADVGIGYSWDGTNFTPPPPGPPTYRTLLSHQEWVNTWTATEWASLNAAASGTSEPPVSQSVTDTVAQLLASVSASNSINVASAQADTDYSYLEANGFIDAARKAELQQGIEET
jgi:hypothetical protein